MHVYGFNSLNRTSCIYPASILALDLNSWREKKSSRFCLISLLTCDVWSFACPDFLSSENHEYSHMWGVTWHLTWLTGKRWAAEEDGCFLSVAALKKPPFFYSGLHNNDIWGIRTLRSWLANKQEVYRMCVCSVVASRVKLNRHCLSHRRETLILFMNMLLGVS